MDTVKRAARKIQDPKRQKFKREQHPKPRDKRDAYQGRIIQLKKVIRAALFEEN